MAETGMKLNLWHGFDPEKRNETKGNLLPKNCNVTVEVPKGWTMLWRGDVVHGGALANRGDNKGLRAHWHIPMKEDDRKTTGNWFLDKNTLARVDPRVGGSFLIFWPFRMDEHSVLAAKML